MIVKKRLAERMWKKKRLKQRQRENRNDVKVKRRQMTQLK